MTIEKKNFNLIQLSAKLLVFFFMSDENAKLNLTSSLIFSLLPFRVAFACDCTFVLHVHVIILFFILHAPFFIPFLFQLPTYRVYLILWYDFYFRTVLRRNSTMNSMLKRLFFIYLCTFAVADVLYCPNLHVLFACNFSCDHVMCFTFSFSKNPMLSFENRKISFCFRFMKDKKTLKEKKRKQWVTDADERKAKFAIQ